MNSSDSENIDGDGQELNVPVKCNCDTCEHWAAPDVCSAGEIQIIKAEDGHCVCDTYKEKS